ncbi:MAG: anthranilate synthase component I family protein [Dysgonamonadaceae bacterium]|jgi:anthranilate synthase component 1|nr:anthranilate synthase component I family protein [Dysgonamonadaceae bacterium]
MSKQTIHVVSKTILADLHTPVSIYLKVRDIYPKSVLLESSDSHGNENPYSFIGVHPIACFKVENNLISEQFPDGKTITKAWTKDNSVVEELNDFLGSFQIDNRDQTVRYNGFFGYSTFDSVRYFEDVETRKQPTPASQIPEIMYLFYRFIIVVNHFKNELTIIENLTEGQESKMQDMITLLENRNYASYNFATNGDEQSMITDQDYLDMVNQGIAHCQRGDVFQIVLSRCYTQPFIGDDFKVYRSLRSINPSPYLFYFDFGSFKIFGSSPETHCNVSKNSAYIDPIAGTFQRTGDDEKDKKLAEALLNDPKENAEHVMLVDLARNDLSRNTSQVKVEFFKEVQYYSHVIHLVSRVSGVVAPNTNTIKVFADTFPAGTLTGAPKIRAIQLIQAIERHDRGAYGGCIGYIGLDGAINHAITIRSFVSKNNMLYYQAGAGIVSQSKDRLELQEVKNKLGALKNAILMAEEIKN